MKTKRIFSSAIAAAMLFGAFSFTALADETCTFAVTTADSVKGTVKSTMLVVNDSSYYSSLYEQSKSIPSGAKVKVSAEAVVKGNYEFKGWYTDADGTGTALGTDIKLSGYIFDSVTEDTTVYAVFKATDEYSGVIDSAEAWLGDYSTKTDYTISSVEEWRYFTYCSNILNKNFAGKTVTLTADLDFENNEYEPIGYKTPFAGTFDGGNNTVRNVSSKAAGYKIETATAPYNSYRGLFGRAAGSSVIKNITLDGGYFAYSYQVGGIAGYATGTVENVTVKNTYIEGYHCGGVVGESRGVTIKNAEVDGLSVGTGLSGAIIGYADNLKVDGADVKNVQSTVFEDGQIGGIVAARIDKGNSVLSNIKCNVPSTGFIGLDYGSAGTITVNGDTDVIAKHIINESSYTLNIEEGNFVVEKVTEAAAETSKITAKRYTTFNIEVADYAEEGCFSIKQADGTYIVDTDEINTDTSSAFTGQAEGEIGATGFVTTITANKNITVKSVTWTVSSDMLEDGSKNVTPESFAHLTLDGGTAQVIIIIDRLYDSAATAVAAAE